MPTAATFSRGTNLPASQAYSAGTFTQLVQLAANPSKSLRQSYIHLTKGPPFEEAAGRAKKQGLRMYELFSAGHDAMVTQPKELAKILLGLL